MRTHRNRVLPIAAFSWIAFGAGAGQTVAQDIVPVEFAEAGEVSYQGATAREEALLRRQMQIMRPDVLPLRVIFVPHWKYLADTRIYRLHVPTGYASIMFTHLPSRTVFIDTDRYISDDSLGYWMAHELGHLATKSVREADAERNAAEYRRRLRAARHDLARDSFSQHLPFYTNEQHSNDECPFKRSRAFDVVHGWGGKHVVVAHSGVDPFPN